MPRLDPPGLCAPRFYGGLPGDVREPVEKGVNSVPLIYIVDDEESVRKLIAIALTDAGYKTRDFASSAEFLDVLEEERPDLVILDWMMPPPDGLDTCRILRQNDAWRTIPVIMLTARTEEFDKVLGLEMGADDYITKPFGVKELCARVKALLRRQDYGKQDTGTLTYRDITVDLKKRKVKKDGKTLECTLKEFELLAMLMKNRGRVLTRTVLLDTIWGVDYFGDGRTIDVHIRNLRQKLGDHDGTYIETLRGVGYRFAEEEDD